MLVSLVVLLVALVLVVFSCYLLLFVVCMLLMLYVCVVLLCAFHPCFVSRVAGPARREAREQRLNTI